MNKRECENGHKGVGIGFDEFCPECEAPWKQKKASEMFEGENSSLRRAFDRAVKDTDITRVPALGWIGTKPDTQERCPCGVLLSEHGSGASGYCAGSKDIKGATGAGGDTQDKDWIKRFRELTGEHYGTNAETALLMVIDEAVSNRDKHWQEQEMAVAKRCEEHCKKAVEDREKEVVKIIEGVHFKYAKDPENNPTWDYIIDEILGLLRNDK